jgi:predicted transglutaminase-like cysteine proteinase
LPLIPCNNPPQPSPSAALAFKRKPVISRLALWLPLVFQTLAPSPPGAVYTLPDATVQQARQQYDEDGYERVVALRDFINENQQESDWNKLHLVNQFANRQVRFVSDREHWGQLDYWASPLESLGTGAGDCEDYSILKYFMLRAMGIPDDKLRLMYVRALRQNEPHMVLVYFENPQDYPLVLDNLESDIRSASERTDLKPVYSFNASGLWLARAGGLGHKVQNHKGNSHWLTVLEKIEHGQ